MNLIKQYKLISKALANWACSTDIKTPEVIENIGYIIKTAEGYYVDDHKHSENVQEARFITDLTQSIHALTCSSRHRKIGEGAELHHAIIRDGEIMLISVTYQ